MALLFCGCRTTPKPAPTPALEPALERFEFSEPHMGTLFSITLYAANPVAAKAASTAAFQRIALLDRMMTDYDPKSELMRLCARPAGEAVHVSPELFDILRESKRVAAETGGAFDITVGPFVQAWRAARKSKVLPTPAEIATMRRSIGSDKLKLDARAQTVTLMAPGMRLDLGGIAKGYAADQALIEMRKLGIRRALVAASGDIAAGDAPPGRAGWRVGIQALDAETGDLAKTVLLHNAGVSTSGDTEQHVEINGVRYSHIIDPATGLGLTNHIQATIIGPNATISDGLDTPLCILGLKRGLKLVDSRPDLAALIVVVDGTGHHVFPSKTFKRRFEGN